MASPTSGRASGERVPPPTVLFMWADSRLHNSASRVSVSGSGESPGGSTATDLLLPRKEGAAGSWEEWGETGFEKPGSKQGWDVSHPVYYRPLPARTGIRVGASPPPTFRATVPYALSLFMLLLLGLPLLQYC